MLLPTPYKIGVRRLETGATDAHGNSTDTYAQPIYQFVYSISPTTSTEPYESGREAVVTGLTVLAPVGTDVRPSDLVVWNNEEYTVEGEIADWSRGPFDWAPGVSIQLKRVEG